MASQVVMVVSGYNTRAVIAFCRWAKQHDIAYHIVAQGDADPIFLTDFQDRVAITRSSRALNLEAIKTWIAVLRERHGHNRVIILPSTEYLNRFILHHRKEIESAGGVVPLVPGELYTKVSDKYAFAAVCKSFGLDVPREYPDAPKRFPFVAKPRQYTSTNGEPLAPSLIFSEGELAEFRRNRSEADFFFQELVEGRSFYLLAHISRSGEDTRFSQENLVQQAGGGSILLARASDFHTTVVAQSYVDMFKEMGFHGLVMVEVRYEASQDRYSMIEANPRLWGPLQFALDNQVDFLAPMLAGFGFELPRNNLEKRKALSHYFWSGGFCEAALPLAYHNYSAEQFIEEYPRLRGCDIYLREDTLGLYYHESKMVGGDE